MGFEPTTLLILSQLPPANWATAPSIIIHSVAGCAASVNRVLRRAGRPSTIVRIMEWVQQTLSESFLLRWTLANLVGWAVGLYTSAWTLRSPVICLNGALAAACIGLAQWLVLRRDYGFPGRWVLLAALGGALGVLPAFFLIITFIWGGGMFAALLGLSFGAALGGMQWLILRPYPRAEWWILASGVGGALGGLLSVTTIIGGLPLGLLLGGALYGLVTGKALQRLVVK